MARTLPNVDRRTVIRGLAGAGSLSVIGTAQAEASLDEEVDPELIATVYRLYSGSQGDHFYTTSQSERNNAIENLGYQDEGIEWIAFDEQRRGTTAVYRLYSSEQGDHFYTTSASERDNAANNLGYRKEGVLCYVYDRNRGFNDPVYRLYSGSQGDHFYTTSSSERDNAVRNLGYRDEGVLGYAFAL